MPGCVWGAGMRTPCASELAQPLGMGMVAEGACGRVSRACWVGAKFSSCALKADHREVTFTRCACMWKVWWYGRSGDPRPMVRGHLDSSGAGTRLTWQAMHTKGACPLQDWIWADIMYVLGAPALLPSAHPCIESKHGMLLCADMHRHAPHESAAPVHTLHCSGGGRLQLWVRCMPAWACCAAHSWQPPLQLL